MRLRDHRMLQQYMGYRNLNVRQLAKLAGVSRATVGHLHSGARQGACSPKTARAIEQALQAPPGLLFDARPSNVSREVAA